MQEYEQKFEQVSEDQKLSKSCSDESLKLVEKGQYSFFSLDTEGQEIQHLCSETQCFETKEVDSCKGLDLQEYEIRFSLGHEKFAFAMIDTVLKSWSHLCLKTEPLLRLESWTVLTSTQQNRC